MPKEIAKALNKNDSTVRGLLKKMRDADGVLVDKDGGYYLSYFPQEVSQNSNSVNATNVNTINGSTAPATTGAPPFAPFTLSGASADNEQAIPAPTPKSGNGQKPDSATASTSTAKSQNMAPDLLPTTGNGQPPATAEELASERQDAVAEPAGAADNAWNEILKEMGNGELSRCGDGTPPRRSASRLGLWAA